MYLVFDEVFAPVVRHTTFRILLAIAGKKHLMIKHYDAKTAFLNGYLKETVYMSQPEGYEIEDRRYACKLNKSIYGLKQAARVWNEQLHETLVELGFNQSEVDPCLYILVRGEDSIYLIVYVDDILIAAKTNEKIGEIAKSLKNRFPITDLGALHHYLGVQVERNEGIYYIHQSNYIEKVASSVGLDNARSSKIPLDPGYMKARRDHEPMEKMEQYQQLIGALLYIATISRPDISASVTILSQFNKNPTQSDWTEAKRIVRYLMGTKDLKLKLGGEFNNESIEGYADADWAGYSVERKSHSGYVYLLYGGCISWTCRKQSCVALSSTEAEYIALSEACQEGMWISYILRDLLGKDSLKLTLYDDNQSCIQIATNNKFSNRTKHIETRYHFVRRLRQEKIIELKYCPTDQMIADLLTKPLSATKLNFLLQKCNLQNQ